MKTTGRLLELPRAAQTAMIDIAEECVKATQIHHVFASAHEGLAILEEEVDELRREVYVKHEHRNIKIMRKEAVQVAAMAVCFITDICSEETKPGLQRVEVWFECGICTKRAVEVYTEEGGHVRGKLIKKCTRCNADTYGQVMRHWTKDDDLALEYEKEQEERIDAEFSQDQASVHLIKCSACEWSGGSDDLKFKRGCPYCGGRLLMPNTDELTGDG